MDDGGTDRDLTTAEVAQRLGVKAETVYAYVSRGLLTSRPAPGRRGSRFSAAEVERLATRERRSAGVVETVSSAITLIQGDDLWFRGHRVTDLAGRSTFPAVAGLLWNGSLDDPPTFVSDPAAVGHARAAVAALPATARLTDRIRVAVAALATSDIWRHDLSAPAVVAAGGALLRGVVDTIAPEPDAGASLVQQLGRAVGGLPADLTETVLILMADHGLAVSTLSARVAASARADIYAVVSAGVGTMDGPLHGGTSVAAHRFLVDAAEDLTGALTERLRAGGPPPGFGHGIYRSRDPRAAVLFDLVEGTAAAQLAERITDRIAGRPGMVPNVDLALAAVVLAHGLRPDVGEALFMVARTVGLIAHALEEYADPVFRFRVPGRYTGPAPLH